MIRNTTMDNYTRFGKIVIFKIV